MRDEPLGTAGFGPLVWAAPGSVRLVPVPVATQRGLVVPYGCTGPLIVPGRVAAMTPMGEPYRPMALADLHRLFESVATSPDHERAALLFASTYGMLTAQEGQPLREDDGPGGALIADGEQLHGEDVSLWIVEAERVAAVLALLRLVRPARSAQAEAQARLGEVVSLSPAGVTVHHPTTSEPILTPDEEPDLLDRMQRLGVDVSTGAATYAAHSIVNGGLLRHGVSVAVLANPNPRAGSTLCCQPRDLIGAVWAHAALDLARGRARGWRKCARKGCPNMLDPSARRSRRFCSEHCRILSWQRSDTGKASMAARKKANRV